MRYQTRQSLSINTDKDHYTFSISFSSALDWQLDWQTTGKQEPDDQRTTRQEAVEAILSRAAHAFYGHGCFKISTLGNAPKLRDIALRTFQFSVDTKLSDK